MFDFVLPLFPFESAAITVTTTVWIGVVIAVFFNLRLGWTLSALVVPGYLVPLMIARPMSGAVIFLEAVISYFLARAISDAGRLQPWWSNVFGRDRFFVIVVVSVLVRALCDGWLLPWAGQLAVEQYGWNIDYRNDLHSFGLIVVALIANYFWKPGFVRGLLPIATCTAITYAVVAWILVTFTNFNTGNFHLLYEDISVSLTASPKSYLILITTAWFASWINLRYAWDFNGILIPALLALLWHDPAKIAVTLAECMVILALATMLLNTKLFRGMAIQGGRKLVFFFTICFVFRLFLSHVMAIWFPGVSVTDAYGMGYLLSTLVAMKAHDKKQTVKMINGAVQVSVIGAVAGSIFGFVFFCAPRIHFGFSGQSVEQTQEEQLHPVLADKPVMELVREGKILLYEKRIPDSYTPPSVAQLGEFRVALQQLAALEQDFDPALLAPIVQRLDKLNFTLINCRNETILLKERQPVRGWGLFAICPGEKNGLCLEVPSPIDEWATVESAVCLMEQFPATGLAIAGTARNTNRDGSSDVTRSRNSMFAAFHQVFGRDQTLQVRALTRENSDELSLIDQHNLNANGAGPQAITVPDKSQLWIRGAFPESLNLARMKQLTGSFEVLWNDSPFENKLRTGPRFAEIFLSRSARRQLVAGGREATGYIEVAHESLRNWLTGSKEDIRTLGSNGFVPATTRELLYMDQEVLTPLIDALGRLPSQSGYAADGTPAWLNGETGRHLRVINENARAAGYRLVAITDPFSGDEYLALRESGDDSELRGWGTYVFRPGLVEDFAVEIPRPLFETRSFDFGINLFERPRASAMLVAGAHPHANIDGTADISKPSNRTNLYNLVRHVLLRQLGRRPYLISQARAIQSPVDADIVVASDEGTTRLEVMSPLKQKYLAGLLDDQLSLEFISGSYDTAGYELGVVMQATATQISQRKELLSLWLSPSLRTRFRQQSDHDNLSAQFRACHVPTFEGSLTEFFDARVANVTPTRQMPDELRSALNDYAGNFDVLKLYSLIEQFSDWPLTRILDEGSGQIFLAISASDGTVPAIMNLTGAIAEGSSGGTFTRSMAEHGQEAEADYSQLEQFVRSRAMWLEVDAG